MPILVFISTIAPTSWHYFSVQVEKLVRKKRINFAFGLISSHPSNTCVSNMKSKKKGMTTSYEL